MEADKILSIPGDQLDMSALAKPPMKAYTEHQLLSALATLLTRYQAVAIRNDADFNVWIEWQDENGFQHRSINALTLRDAIYKIIEMEVVKLG